MYNAIITDNTAAYGGGLWCCANSDTYMNETLGGTIYGNTATYAGDSISYREYSEEDKSSDKDVDGKAFVSVAPRALGGTLIDWYDDRSDNRYSDTYELVDIFSSTYQNTNIAFSLHGDLSDTGIALARSEAKLYITGNTAEEYGG